MWRGQLKPLDKDAWLAELVQLVDHCRKAESSEHDLIIRRAYNLAQLSPFVIRKLLSLNISEGELDKLLAASEWDDAARGMLGKFADVELVGGPDQNRHYVRISFGDDRSAAFDALTPAFAMIGAWAKYFTEKL